MISWSGKCCQKPWTGSITEYLYAEDANTRLELITLKLEQARSNAETATDDLLDRRERRRKLKDDLMESKLLKEWIEKKLSISKDFDFYTKRDNFVVGKLKDQPAVVEYECPFCKHYEIKNIELEKELKKSGEIGKKFKRPKFKCSSCGKTITVESLKKK